MASLCRAQPFVLLAEHTSCGESPPCTHIQCFTDIRCLLASSLSPVISGCRSDRPLFCVCPRSSAHEDLQEQLPFLPRLRQLSTAFRLRPRDFESLLTSSSLSLRKMSSNRTLELDVVATSTPHSNGLSGGQVAGIVCGVLAFVLLVGLAAYFLFRYMRDRRKNHGEYRPQFEEQHHAKDLPYLQPPAVEGII